MENKNIRGWTPLDALSIGSRDINNNQEIHDLKTYKEEDKRTLKRSNKEL